ncbi:HAD-superfamily hydrolase [Atractiella rhizophila]|nr:HAD-superfamily hydrolase [Atractiella rhizophila]
MFRACLFRPILLPRLYHSATRAAPSFVFDIDGVLTLGSKATPRAQQALQLLNSRGINWMLMTNGGGSLESERAQRLTSQLGVEVEERRLLQAHTPFKDLSAQFKNAPILVIGGRGNKGREIANAYGFTHPFIPLDFLDATPSLYPFYQISAAEKKFTQPPVALEDIGCILVLHDSRNWGLDTQIISDIITLSKAAVKIYFSNPDLLWSNEYPLPRYGQGAFQAVVKTLCQTESEKVEIVQYGKPTKRAYIWAERMLREEAERRSQQLAEVFMIGDNPHSDIAGANAMGWTSVLVKTGVFQGGANSEEYPAARVVDDVYDAVKWALKKSTESS